jgi:hypothetical protein
LSRLSKFSCIDFFTRFRDILLHLVIEILKLETLQEASRPMQRRLLAEAAEEYRFEDLSHDR